MPIFRFLKRMRFSPVNPRGVKMYNKSNKSRNKLLCLTVTEDCTSNPNFTKEINDLLYSSISDF